ncbi:MULTISPECIES: ATP-binding cassette domain-containing protein [unclassified Streptomyces]|uniref:ATP-binding cassette domain-containing protein n=1 Tax=unclassified Streptomyces TaxID=2593676 RepID=UPI0021566B17|nr:MULTISPECIES: ATP-binding cassette domain-containing protein [unclassified Streptomyces]
MDHGARLRLDGVHKAYGSREVLHDVSLRVPPGNLVCVTGAPERPGGECAAAGGAGRTALARIAAGREPADRGTVVRTVVTGFCPQQAVLNDQLTVDQHLRYFQMTYRLADVRRALELLDALGIAHTRHETAGVLDPAARQNVNLTLALMHDPALLVFDEPCQDVDRETRRRFWELACELRDEGRSLLVAGRLTPEPGSFDMLRLADAVYELADGRLTRRVSPATAVARDPAA